MTRADEMSDEMLMALADGELNETDAQHLRKRIAANADLAMRYAEFVETRALMQDAFPPDPVPERLIAGVMQASQARAPVVPFRKRSRAAPIWGMAIAASLVLAVGGFWAGRGTAPGTVAGTNIGIATASLPTGGETLLPDGSTIRVLASYETDLGLCRMIAQDSARHVACRDGQTGDWVLALSVQAGEAGAFLPAADIAVGLIDHLLDEIGAGPAVTGAEEQNLLSR